MNLQQNKRSVNGILVLPQALRKAFCFSRPNVRQSVNASGACGKELETNRLADFCSGAETKRCTKCGEWKVLSEFGKDSRKKDGKFVWCKSCASAQTRRWQKENPEKTKAYIKAWQERNPDWRKRDPLWREKRNAVAERWKKNNPDKARAKRARWNARHPEKILEKIKELTAIKAANPELHKANRRRYKARKRQAVGNITAKEWMQVLDKYGYKCLRCGKTDVALTMDHVVPLKLGGTHTIDNVQPLCMSCNCSKNATYVDYRT